MTAVRIKLDENMARAHANLLRAAGHDTERVFEEGLSGMSDAVVWERACADSMPAPTRVSSCCGHTAEACRPCSPC